MTEDDLNMMHYFYFEKGNIERWCSWEERKPEIAKTNPELIAAYDDMIIRIKIFQKLLKATEHE